MAALKPTWRTADLLAAVAIVDAAISGLALAAAGLPLLAAGVVILTAGLLLAHQGAGSARLKVLIVLGLITVLFVIPEAVLIALRSAQAPVQDGLLLTDAAARRLLAGHDPYGHDYLDDPALRSFFLPEFPVNPLLGHFVYPPGLVLLAAPLVAAGLSFAWFWVAAIIGLAGGAWLAGGRAGMIVVALNPLLLLDYLNLFNDLLFLAPALAGVGLLIRRRGLPAGILLGLALVIKQSAIILLIPAALAAWLLLPASQRLRFAAALTGLPVLVASPFLAWNASSLLSDTAAYFYGSGLETFPIRGYGLPGLLLSWGILSSRWAPYPAPVIQLLALGPLLAAGAVILRERFTLPGFWLWTATISLAVFLFGRTLAPNYVTIAAVLFGLALASSLEDADLPARLERE